MIRIWSATAPIRWLAGGFLGALALAAMLGSMISLALGEVFGRIGIWLCRLMKRVDP